MIRFIAVFLAIICSWVINASAQSLESPQQLVRRALKAYNQKEYSEAARLYSLAINAGENSANNCYDAACSFALAGDAHNAFAMLLLAMDKGYHNPAHLQRDSDLHSLHSDIRWKQMVQRCEANARSVQPFATLWKSSAFTTPLKDNLDENDKIAGLSLFWSEVKYNFSNFDLVPDIDWNALYKEYLPKIRASQSTIQYYRLLMELCARLKDGHTNVYFPQALRDSTSRKPPIHTRLVENKVYIIDVWSDSLRKAGVLPGLEITHINSQPVHDYAAEHVQPFQSASTQQDLQTRTFEYSLLRGSAQTPIFLGCKDASGKKSEFRLARSGYTDIRRMATEFFSYKRLPGNIGYVELASFESDTTAKLFEQRMPEILQHDHLILDLRENGGGNSNVGDKILKHLTEKPFQVSSWKTRLYRPTYRVWNNEAVQWYEQAGAVLTPTPSDTKSIFRGTVIVLISPRTFSAAEDFCVGFINAQRGVIIGEASGGSTGQPLFITLPGGGSARICTKRDTFPDGKEFVGKGIQPDIMVRQTFQALRAGKDEVLEAAIHHVSKKR